MGSPLESIDALRDLDQVVAELSFDGAVNLAQFTAEYHFVKLFNHLARAERSQRSTGLAGRAGGKLRGDGTEILSFFDLIFQILTGFFGFNENMSCTCSGHDVSWVVFRRGVVRGPAEVESRSPASATMVACPLQFENPC